MVCLIFTAENKLISKLVSVSVVCNSFVTMPDSISLLFCITRACFCVSSSDLTSSATILDSSRILANASTMPIVVSIAFSLFKMVASACTSGVDSSRSLSAMQPQTTVLQNIFLFVAEVVFLRYIVQVLCERPL